MVERPSTIIVMKLLKRNPAMNRDVTIGVVLGVVAVVALIIASWLIFRYWKSTESEKTQLFADKIDPYTLEPITPTPYDLERRQSNRRSKIQSIVRSVRQRTTAIFNFNKPLPPPPPGEYPEDEFPTDVDDKNRTSIDVISEMLTSRSGISEKDIESLRARQRSFQLPNIRTSVFSIQPARFSVQSGMSTPMTVATTLPFPLPPGAAPPWPHQTSPPPAVPSEVGTNMSGRTLVPPFAMVPGAGKGLQAATMYRNEAPVPPPPSAPAPTPASSSSNLLNLPVGSGADLTPSASLSSITSGSTNVVVAQRPRLAVPRLAPVPRSLKRRQELKYKQPSIDDFPAPPPFPPPVMPAATSSGPPSASGSGVSSGRVSPTSTYSSKSGSTNNYGFSVNRSAASSRNGPSRPPADERGSLLPIQAPPRSITSAGSRSQSQSQSQSRSQSRATSRNTRRSSYAQRNGVDLPLYKTASGDFDIAAYYQFRSSGIWVSSPQTPTNEYNNNRS